MEFSNPGAALRAAVLLERRPRKIFSSRILAQAYSSVRPNLTSPCLDESNSSFQSLMIWVRCAWSKHLPWKAPLGKSAGTSPTLCHDFPQTTPQLPFFLLTFTSCAALALAHLPTLKGRNPPSFSHHSPSIQNHRYYQQPLHFHAHIDTAPTLITQNGHLRHY
jgi:hypothetical protein